MQVLEGCYRGVIVDEVQDPRGRWWGLIAATMVGRFAACREQVEASDVFSLTDRLLEYRDRVGLSYFSLFDPGEEQLAYLAEHVLEPLSGR